MKSYITVSKLKEGKFKGAGGKKFIFPSATKHKQSKTK
jgi:hypothetical protein